MAKGFKHGAGGGTSLNFKVVGGTSAPSNPKENTIWVNTSTEITSWDFSATEPTKRSKNNNLILYPYYNTTKTSNGITFTSNADGTITVNGTATAESTFDIIYCWSNKLNYPLEVGKTYTLSGCPSGGAGNSYYLQAVFRSVSDTATYVSETGRGLTFTADTTKYHIGVRIAIISGAKVSNLVFKPQLEKGSTATSFVKGDATGQVWVSTGTSSTAPFNALKKNGIMVYPMSAKQYVNGAWVSNDARIQKDGNLKAFHFVVVPNIGINWVSSNTTVNKTSTATELSITVKSSADSSKGTAGSYVEVDTTGYDTIFVKIKHKANNTTGSDQGFSVALETASGTAVASGFGLTIPNHTNSAEQTLERTIDISALSGVYRLWFRATTYSPSSTIHYVTITDCRLC